MRYAIISNYYQSQPEVIQVQVQEISQQNDVVKSGIKEHDQLAIHPSLKKLIGKKPLNYQQIINSSRTTRNSGHEAPTTSSIKDKVSIKIEKSGTSTTVSSTPLIVQEPKVIQLTSSRGKNQLHRIVVGNTSQYLQETSSSSSITHKWMCYVKTKSSVPLEQLVKKVRFHLDPSYKPNDVVEVSSPFQLTRRGYKQFQLKVLIFFKDDLRIKPVTIYHQLVLDKTLTGHQVLGKETVTELWTREFLNDETAELVHPSVKVVTHDHDYFATETSQVRLNQEACVNDDRLKIIDHHDVNKWINEFTQRHNINDSDSDEIELN